ncbi:hypothetical protein [Niabella beijingensis]|uniref:hypothetical protein n=1 Tax=Niabella beijingensis TaxID=2872700 RepID=UPI001CBB7447|nr:hypothetical protein [Niabella beijingensis]MBZ4191300.1 hypothetical protein [Niabella beijingensis]
MRTTIIGLLIAGCLSCGGHNREEVTVSERNGMLRIRMHIVKSGRTLVNYDKSFPAAAMRQTERNELVSHILDSLKQRY